MLHGIGIEQMEQQQVRAMLFEDETGGLGPGGIYPGHVLPVAPWNQPICSGAQQAGGNHLLLHLAVAGGDFRKAPVDGPGAGHGDPIDLGGSKAGPIGQIVKRGGEDQAVLVDPGLDFGRLVWPAAYQQAVEEHAVSSRRDTGDQRGVVDPGDRRVGDRHRVGGRTLAGETAEIRQRKGFVMPEAGRKTVKGDENHMLVGMLRLRLC